MRILRVADLHEAVIRDVPSGHVGQRVPKKLLLEHSAPVAADKRLITDAVEDIHWHAALKPGTIGVPAYQDAQREYLEIAVLGMRLRGQPTPASAARLAALLHRAVPYPVWLLQTQEQGQGVLTLSLAHKRRAQNEAGKTVLDGEPTAITLPAASTASDALAQAFTQSLALSHQPQAHLHALYQGWLHCLHAWQAAQHTGHYRLASTPAQAAARQQALADCQRLQAEVAQLRAQAAKAKQMARQVELNLALQRARAQLAAAQQQL